MYFGFFTLTHSGSSHRRCAGIIAGITGRPPLFFPAPRWEYAIAARPGDCATVFALCPWPARLRHRHRSIPASRLERLTGNCPAVRHLAAAMIAAPPICGQWFRVLPGHCWTESPSPQNPKTPPRPEASIVAAGDARTCSAIDALIDDASRLTWRPGATRTILPGPSSGTSVFFRCCAWAHPRSVPVLYLGCGHAVLALAPAGGASALRVRTSGLRLDRAPIAIALHGIENQRNGGTGGADNTG